MFVITSGPALRDREGPAFRSSRAILFTRYNLGAIFSAASFDLITG